MLRFVRHFRETTGRRNLCLAGGVALNVKMNSHLRRSGMFDDIFVFPIPSDSGTAIGAAVGVYHELTGRRPKPLDHLYFGPGFSDEEIELQIKSCGLRYRVCDDIAEATADLLVQGKVVGWFQGRMEGGPRALGGRSILADPRSVPSRDRVNAAIKFREYWRPFCPSLLEEQAARFVRDAAPAPFMITAFEATEQASELCPAIVHVDRTMRVQTVNDHSHPRFLPAAQGVRAPHRGSGAAQHVLQHQGRSHRVLAARRPAYLLEHRPRRAGDRPLPDREAADAGLRGA